jgi:SAM-dependent methyltransferase
MNDSVFGSYSYYYDLLYRDKDYRSEARYIQSVLDRFEVSGRDILEFGSGTGMHARLLAQSGYSVLGIDRSQTMVDQAATCPGFTSQQGDISTLHLGRSFNAIISLFHVISYQITNESVLSVFSRAYDHLEANGLFIFDAWYSPAVYSQKPEVRVKRMAVDELEITRVAEPVTNYVQNTVDVHYNIFARQTSTNSISTFSEVHHMRHFSIPEVELLAQMSGFKLLHAEEFLSGETPSDDTWGVCFVLRRVS